MTTKMLTPIVLFGISPPNLPVRGHPLRAAPLHLMGLRMSPSIQPYHGIVRDQGRQSVTMRCMFELRTTLTMSVFTQISRVTQYHRQKNWVTIRHIIGVLSPKIIMGNQHRVLFGISPPSPPISRPPLRATQILPTEQQTCPPALLCHGLVQTPKAAAWVTISI